MASALIFLTIIIFTTDGYDYYQAPMPSFQICYEAISNSKSMYPVDTTENENGVVLFCSPEISARKIKDDFIKK